jgi:hypothetical protein
MNRKRSKLPLLCDEIYVMVDLHLHSHSCVWLETKIERGPGVVPFLSLGVPGWRMDAQTSGLEDESLINCHSIGEETIR